MHYPKGDVLQALVNFNMGPTGIIYKIEKYSNPNF